MIIGCSDTICERLTGIDRNTVSAVRLRLYQRVAASMVHDSPPFGGPGTFVEIDECYIRGLCVVGAVLRGHRDQYFICEVITPDAITLESLIERYILPGTMINTDSWAAYPLAITRCNRPSPTHPAGMQLGHDRCNHSAHQWVTPTGATINYIESMWRGWQARPVQGPPELSAMFYMWAAGDIANVKARVMELMMWK
jgi:hypothetical protein